MWRFAERAANDVLQMTGGLDREHWIIIGVIVLAIGAFLMKGFGSRI